MYYVYILYSESMDRYYVGNTSNLEARLDRHNNGESRYTKSGIPWQIMYTEEYRTRKEAMSREHQIKKWKSRKMIKKLIEGKI
jgi:putative endonuclease